jgi:hypothetical protein
MDWSVVFTSVGTVVLFFMGIALGRHVGDGKARGEIERRLRSFFSQYVVSVQTQDGRPVSLESLIQEVTAR